MDLEKLYRDQSHWIQEELLQRQQLLTESFSGSAKASSSILSDNADIEKGKSEQRGYPCSL